jgi:hypothetical protein
MMVRDAIALVPSWVVNYPPSTGGDLLSKAVSNCR